jgi:hypothetical protein
MQAELMNCSVEYEEEEEREMPLHIELLPERGKISLQAPQECVEDSAKSRRAMDRGIRVSRIRKGSEPPAQKKGRE